MTEQEYREICAEVQNSGIPVPSQEKIIEACSRRVGKKDNDDHRRCMACGTWHNFIISKLANPKDHPIIYCWNCGQAIDWSDEE